MRREATIARIRRSIAKSAGEHMVWETVAWQAMVISGLLIVIGYLRGRGLMHTGHTGNAEHTADEQTSPLYGWLETAWSVFFIASLGLITLKELMSFAAVLVLAVVLTGGIWLIDFLLRKQRPEMKRTAVTATMVDTARSFFPIILIVFMLRAFLYEPFKIPSESMLPTLRVGDFILVNKFAYGTRLPVINKKIVERGNPERGDVMVFRLPENPAKDLIKRVVGLPGDRIEYRNKLLSINGQAAELKALQQATEADKRLGITGLAPFRETFTGKPHTVLTKPDMPTLNLAGVRRFPNIEQCEYRADGFACTVPAGHYFTLGDNRDNSDDSRYWGFVPDENIVGKAILVWMNWGNMKRAGTRIE
jgi:signal peptidase I